MSSSSPGGLVWKPEQNLPWRSVCGALDTDLRGVTDEVYRRSGVNRSLLLRKLLLHLPRFSCKDLECREVLLKEAWRLAESIASLQRDYRRWLNKSTIPQLDAARLSLKVCTPGVAQAIHQRFHYIGHFHDGIAHLGLYGADGGEDVPLALASLSHMDVSFLKQRFPAPEARRAVLQITRVYAFDWAPRNTISFLFGRVLRWIKQNLPEISTLLSYVNPNLGFSGSSYFASNWSRYLERAPIYSYLDGNYMPYRIFLSLPEPVKKSATHSQYPMDNLLLLRYTLVRKREFNIRPGVQECRATT
jgi:hypothetical protein